MEGIYEVRRMHESNRAAWNEAAVNYDAIIGDRQRLPGGGTTLKPVELRELGSLEGWCGRAIHLQCASGADTLSLVNAGAASVVGIDISDVHIDNARRKSEAMGFPARWYRTDVLDTPAELDGSADLVYTGKGAIQWLHDLAGWAAVVHRLLKPGGRFYLFEEHPITWLFDPEAATYQHSAEWSYFRIKPDESQGWPSAYIPRPTKPASQQAKKYGKLWPVSTVINELLAAGLLLERFNEHQDLPYSFPLFPNIPPEEAAVLPQSFSLFMRRG